MRAIKMEVLLIDHDGLGDAGAKWHLENARYPNRCMSPRVLSLVSRDIGEWDDDHPLNWESTTKAEVERLFGKHE